MNIYDKLSLNTMQWNIYIKEWQTNHKSKFDLSLLTLKVSKSQKQFFLKTKFCPIKLGQNFVKYFVRFLGNGVSRKIVFEIYWPLNWTVNRCWNLRSTYLVTQVFCGQMKKYLMQNLFIHHFFLNEIPMSFSNFFFQLLNPNHSFQFQF